MAGTSAGTPVDSRGPEGQGDRDQRDSGESPNLESGEVGKAPRSDLNVEHLHYLANLNGVATQYWNWTGQLEAVEPLTLLKVLEELGAGVTPTSTNHEIEAAINACEEREWRQTLPDCTVVRQGSPREIPVHVPDGAQVQVTYQLEDGRTGSLPQLDRWVPPRQIDGQPTGRATFQIPADLPLGYHQLVAEVQAFADQPATTARRALYVVPERVDSSVLARPGRYWGVNAQAYSVPSRNSWGLGDAADLADLTAICAQYGADFLLVNPLHACEPTVPLQDSPYLPVSRQWLNATYIRPQAIPEYAKLDEDARSRIEKLQAEAAAGSAAATLPLLDRNAAWQAKRQALYEIFQAPRSISRQAEFETFCTDGGDSLRNHATWCALVEKFGSIDLPPEVASPDLPETRHQAAALAEAIEFHMWCQWVIAEQFGQVRAVADALHMPIGIMADLAVGIHPSGSAVWANPHVYARSMSVGAPPDMYSQQGQDWSQPPFNPRELERTGYSAYIEVLRTALSFAGALRVDHILGLFRLWWIPQGASAKAGTYVSFDHEAMVGILCLEAARAGALLVGEDLGTVEPWVRDYLASRGILGTSVLWFETDPAGWPLDPADYRRDVLAAVNTHDLPPSAGYIEGIHTTLRDQLGLLVDPVEKVREADRLEQERMDQKLRDMGLLSENPTPMEKSLALHRFIARVPSRLIAMSLVDAVGEVRPQNLPGTYLQYPNWRIPLADGQGKRVWLEDLAAHPGLNALSRVFREEIG